MKVILSYLFVGALLLAGCQPIQSNRFPLEEGGGPLLRVQDMKRISLRVDDLPEGWVMFEDQPLSNNEQLADSWNDAAAAKIKLDALGREGGWYQYVAKPGLFFETNEVNISLVVLKNPQAAIDYLEFNYLRDKEAVDRGEYTSFSAVSAPKFGETSVVMFGKKPKEDDPASSWTWYDVSFQMHNVAVFIETYSTNAIGDMSEAVRIARLIEKRLTID